METRSTNPKRKSFELEQIDSENLAPVSENLIPVRVEDTQIIKKLKSRGSEIINGAIKPEKSSLPRFHGRSRASTAVLTNGTATTTKKVSISAVATIAPTINSSTLSVEPIISNVEKTPAREIRTEVQTRSQRKMVVDNHVFSDRISTFFDTGISIKEVEVGNIMAPLRSKGKWFEKDKQKKFENATKELHAALMKIINEVHMLQKNCVSHESSLISTMSDMREKLNETTSVVTSLRNNEDRLKAQILKLREDADDAKKSSSTFQNECNRLRALEADYGKLQERLRAEEMLRQRAETIASQIEKEIATSKIAAQLSVSEIKDEYNQVRIFEIHIICSNHMCLYSELSNRFLDIKMK